MERVVITEREKNEIIESAREFLASKQKEISNEENAAFVKMIAIANDEYCEAYGVPNDLLYEMICYAEVSDLFFLHSKRFDLKAKCMIECINRENYDLANELFKKMVRLSKYRDYVVDGCTDWEDSNFRTMQNVILNYPLDEYTQWYNEPVTAESRNFAFNLVESMLPFLETSSQKELYAGLMFAERDSKYVDMYINDLLYVVENYAQRPRRKNGFGSALSINDATLKIKKSFSNLLRLNRIDVIQKIMSIIKDAGENLKPINYKMFCEGIQHQFGKEIYEKIMC